MRCNGFPTDVKMKLTFKRGDKDVSATVKPIDRGRGVLRGSRAAIESDVEEIRKVDNWGEAFQLGLRETKESIMQIVTTLRKIASGGVSASGLGGPGTIAVVAAASASQGIPKLLIFLTLLSANLAVINFLPIPILDGGHMMFLLYEGIRGKPASERVQMYLTYLGLVFILALMVFVIGLDLTRLRQMDFLAVSSLRASGSRKPRESRRRDFRSKSPVSAFPGLLPAPGNRIMPGSAIAAIRRWPVRF